jgi:hypothetical protein
MAISASSYGPRVVRRFTNISFAAMSGFNNPSMSIFNFLFQDCGLY